MFAARFSVDWSVEPQPDFLVTLDKITRISFVLASSLAAYRIEAEERSG